MGKREDAVAVLNEHGRMAVAAAAQRPVIQDALAEIVFTKTRYTHEEVLEIWKQLDGNGMSVRTWLARQSELQ